MSEAKQTTATKTKFFPSATASFFVLGLGAGIAYGLIDGLINVYQSAALPLGMVRLGVETLARDLRGGLRAGLVLGAFFLIYGLVLTRLTRNTRRAAVALLVGVVVWLAGVALAALVLTAIFDKRVPMAYQEHVTPKILFSQFIGPVFTYTLTTRPVLVLIELLLSFIVPATLGLAALKLLGKRIGDRPFRFVPSLALTGKAAIVGGVALAAVVLLTFSPAAFGRPRGALNVMLVSIDTLRADGLSCYGNPHQTSPVIDLLAADGTRYENIFSSAPWTLPGHVTMLTGLEPDVHGTYDINRTIPRTAVLLSEIFKNAGYGTYAATSNFLVSPLYGFGRGFDEYLFLPEGRSDKVRNMTLGLLQKAKSPWFMFVHFFDTHLPYQPTEQSKKELGVQGPAVNFVLSKMTHLLYNFIDNYYSFNQEQRDVVRALYGCATRDVDRALGVILSRVNLANTVVIITSDHGEEFNEHGWLGHTVTLYDEALRVPLIVHGPGVQRGLVVNKTTDLTQVLPLIMQLTGLRDPYGRNEPRFGQGAYGHTHAFGNHRYSWRTDSWSFLTLSDFTYGQRHFTHPPSLFNNPAEQENLISLDPDRAAQMQDEMEHFAGRQIKLYGRMTAGETVLDKQRLKRLRELGYVN